MLRLTGLDHVQLAIPAGGEDEARRFYGSVLGLNVNMSGGGSIHYDLALTTGGKIVIVK